MHMREQKYKNLRCFFFKDPRGGSAHPPWVGEGKGTDGGTHFWGQFWGPKKIILHS